jgi:hypothetical protein
MPSAGHGEQRTRRTEEAIAALLTCPTIREAAASIGVNETTLVRWLNDSTFKAEYQRARRQVLESALAKLQAATGKAVDTLVRLLEGDSPNAACRAAALILEHAHKAQEWIDLSGRVEQLEATLPRTVLPGAPPHKLVDRVKRLEIHAPAGCAVCRDVDELVDALVAAGGDGRAANCPNCGSEIADPLLALNAELAAKNILLETPGSGSE